VVKFLLDTNILIDHLRGDAKATVLLHEIAVGRTIASISVITESEMLSASSLTSRQLRDIAALLNVLPKLAVTSHVAQTAARFRRLYRVDLADALIAATAYLANATLITRNLKHFRPVRELRVQDL
jgi:predicted nucleic acid-binding protein